MSVPRTRVVLLPAVLLAAALSQSAFAQGPIAPRTWNPNDADPQYSARKQRRAQLPAPAVSRAARPAQAAPAARTTVALPPCWVPLDTTATGGWRELARIDDSSEGPVPLGFDFSLYGAVYHEVYINTNGNITFGNSFTTFTADGFPISTPMIAPFWADVDAEVDSMTSALPSGNVWYKVFPDHLTVTWNRVGYYQRHADMKNTFQVTIWANTSPSFTGNDVTFAYGDMQWTTGDASGLNGGSNVGGFGGTPATVGANRGNGTNFIQIGRFNLNDSTHPNNTDPSGINWLDGQCISFRVGPNSTNLAPVATNMPAGNTITLTPGQTRTITPQFVGPETGQIVNVTTNTNGLCNTTVANNNAANPTVAVSVTGAACNLGTHTISFTATDDGTPVAQQTFDVTVVVVPDFTWTGAVSTAYTNPANWSSNQVPTATDDALIPAGVPRLPVLSGSAAVRNLTIASGANLTVAAGGIFSLNGNLTNNGQLLGAGTLQSSGPAPQTFSGTGEMSIYNATIGAAGVVLGQPLALDRVLTLNGNLTSNGNLTLHSDDAGTAMVVNNGAAEVLGNVKVERFIGPATNPQLGYRHVAAPVRNTTVADLAVGSFTPVVNPNYNTQGNTVTPFPTVFGYDETRVSSGATLADFDKGWVSPPTTAFPLTPGQGFTVNMLGRQVMDFVGTLGNGTVTRGSLTRGAGSQAGWHLLGNPYPAPLNFSQLTLSGVDNAVYVFKSSGQYTGSYASYINGVPVNGGTNILPQGQAFFVHTTQPGVAGSVVFTNAARLSSYQNPDMQRTGAETRPLLQLELRNAAGTAAEQLAVYFQAGATAGFDPAYDAYRLGNGNTVQLGAAASPADLAISGLPALGTAPVTVPLTVRVAQGGSYTLLANEVLNLPTGWTATLHDGQTGAAVALQSQARYTCTIAPNEGPGRFWLTVEPARPLAAGAAHLQAQVSVFPNPAHGTATLALPATTQPVEIVISNALGQQVHAQRVPASRAAGVALPLTGLAKGVYNVRVALPAGVVTKRLVIE